MKLSYSTNGLVNLDILTAIDFTEDAGYSGIELSFDKNQFNPFELTEVDLKNIKQHFINKKIKPACIATPTISFLTDRPHEPSIICLDAAGRKQRTNLIKRGIRIAKILGAPIVSFGSGFIRDEHINNPSIDPNKILINSINECLEEIGDKILVIEPEPGMLIETVDDAIALVDKINHKNFGLHIDLCHLYCTEKSYIAALAKAAPYTKYLHLSDTTAGCNLKFVAYSTNMNLDFDFASYLIYFPEICDFLFVNKQHAIYFYDNYNRKKTEIELKNLIQNKAVQYIDYNQLNMAESSLSKEINTYTVSVPGLSFYVLDRAKPILRFLREHNQPILNKKVANTLTGNVHYHDIPGTGEIDFLRCFATLKEHSFNGYATVELYHHIDTWQQALHDSFKYLSQQI